MRGALVLVVAIVGSACPVAGCVTAETGRPSGARCESSDGCAGSLVCAYGRCRPECSFDMDCPAGSACVADLSGASARVCTLADELGGGCPAGLVPDAEGACREPCDGAEDCDGGRECSAGVCVEGTGGADGDADSDADEDARCVPSDPVCDLWPQCGCASGQACVQEPTGRRCVVEGDRGHGEVCSDLDGCVAGTACETVYSSPLCRQYCVGDTDCSANGSGSTCSVNVRDGEVSYWLCSVACRPDAADSCPGGAQCRAIPEPPASSPEGHTDCAWPSGPDAPGEPCLFNSCVSGALCEEGLCRWYCVVGEPCTGDLECAPLLERTVVGGVEYGACR